MAATDQLTGLILATVTTVQRDSQQGASRIQTAGKGSRLLVCGHRALASAMSPATRARLVCAGPSISRSTPSLPPPRALPPQSSNVVGDHAARLPTIQRNLPFNIAPENLGNEAALHRLRAANQENFVEEKATIHRYVEELRGILRSLTDGGMSVSAYDTAWVAIVPALDGSPGPQFPKALQWLVDNQFCDGSWGLAGYFNYYDRITSTLACVLALQTWDRGSDTVERGVQFIQRNLHKVGTQETEEEMPIGFEIVFPAMIGFARELGLDLPYDAPIIMTSCAEREKKLKTIPMDILHQVPTNLLYSLEGFQEELDWEKLLKLQEEDGSFLTCPASTAVCLMHTKNEKALAFLEHVLEVHGNGTPPGYPSDLFQHMWIVDRIQRLGIARYFEKEIKDSLDYTFKFFSAKGISWARNTSIQDLDDTAMGFRLLRQHGYDVDESVFKQFVAKNGDFMCWAGQPTGQALTGMFNFYRATQSRYPGEALMESGEAFAKRFLEIRLAKYELFDKWLIARDIPGEIMYALETPWFCSLPRIEHQAYLNHYGPDDIWIGKTLYKMPTINHESYLALARADFNLCRSIHQQNLQETLRWNERCGFGKLTFAHQKAYEAFLTAASVLPDPELATARLVWAQSCVITTVVHDYFTAAATLTDLLKFMKATKEWDPSLMDGAAEEGRIAFSALYVSVNSMIEEGSVAQGRDIRRHLHKIWVEWVESCVMEADWTSLGKWPAFEEYLETALPSMISDPIVLSSQFFLGEPVSDEFLNDPKKLHMMKLANRVGRLLNDIKARKREKFSEGRPNAVSILLRDNSGWTAEQAVSRIEAIVHETMVELVREVHQKSPIPNSIRQAHFNIARIAQFFYRNTDALQKLAHMHEGPLAHNLLAPIFTPLAARI